MKRTFLAPFLATALGSQLASAHGTIVAAADDESKFVTNEIDEVERYGLGDLGRDISRETKNAGRAISDAGKSAARSVSHAPSEILESVAKGAAAQYHAMTSNPNFEDCVLFTAAAVASAGAYFGGPVGSFFGGAAGGAAARIACRAWYPPIKEEN